MSEPDHPIFEMHIDARGNPSVRMSKDVTLLTKEQSEQVLERFKNLAAENAELRELFTDFWKWADPPFALKSGTFEQFMEIVDRAHELGLLETGA